MTDPNNSVSVFLLYSVLFSLIFVCGICKQALICNQNNYVFSVCYQCYLDWEVSQPLFSHPNTTLIIRNPLVSKWSIWKHFNHYIALISTALQHAQLPISLFKGFTKTYFISQSNVTFSWQHGTVHTAEFTMITPFLQCLPQDL